MDISDLHKVSTIHKGRRGQNYDLAYSTKRDKFRLSNSAWDTLRMEQNGFDMFTGPNGEVVVALVPEDDAAMYGRRYAQEDSSPLGKGKNATNRPMRQALNARYGKEVTKFMLRPVGEKEGVRYFEVSPWDNEVGSGLALTEVSTDEEIVTEAPAEATEAAATEEPTAEVTDTDDLFEDDFDDEEEAVEDPFEA